MFAAIVIAAIVITKQCTSAASALRPQCIEAIKFDALKHHVSNTVQHIAFWYGLERHDLEIQWPVIRKQ
jgi:hypothetical protein